MLGREHSKEPLVVDDELAWEGVYMFEEMWDVEEMDLCLNCGNYYIKGGACEC